MIRPTAEVLLALEQECLLVDRAIASRAWDACDASCRRQRKLTHELDIALSALDPASPEAVVARKRIERLQRYRDGQLQKVTSFNASVGKRLSTIRRFRAFAKQRAPERATSHLLDFTS
jgi:hypothetical protein